MKNEEEFSVISLHLIPVIEKGQLPVNNEPVSAYSAKKQGNDGAYGLLAAIREPRQPLNLNEVKIRESKTEFTMTPEEIENAKENYKKINQEYKDRQKKGDKKAVIELLERHPQFIFVGWVKKALKEKPIKSGRKWGSTKISRTLISALVSTLKEKGYSEDRAFKVLSGTIGIKSDRIRDLYYDTEKRLINKPFIVPSIPEPSTLKSIDEYESIDLEQYISKCIKGSMSESYGIYNPEYIWKRGIERYGNEGAKKIISAYIEDAKELLNKDDGNELIKGAKKIVIENGFIEKAKAIMAQIG